MTITNQNKDKEQLNLETFQKCVSETETKFSYIDGQKKILSGHWQITAIKWNICGRSQNRYQRKI